MSTSIYTKSLPYIPYFYIIHHIPSQRYYAGSKYGQNAHPSLLLEPKPRGYHTSSKYVKTMIEEDGLNSFEIVCIRPFETSEQAKDYEHRFLEKVDASHNPRFLNKSTALGFPNPDVISEIMIEKYGVAHNTHLETDIEKRKQTNLARRGVEYSLQSEEVKKKSKQTNLARRGVEYSSQSEEVKEKYKQTNLARRGVEYPLQSEECKEKYRQTNLARRGVEYPLQSKEVREKMKQTNLERRGVSYNSQTEEWKNKFKQTNLERRGVEHPSQSDEIKEKKRQTNLERRSVEYPLQSKEVREKMKQTNLERRGVEHPNQTNEARKRRSILNKEKANRSIIAEIRQYKEKFGVKMPVALHNRADEFLELFLEELEDKYGEMG